MRQDLVVIKLGGASLIDPATRDQVVKTVRDYRRYDYDVVLVHGGGPAINAELTKRNISWTFVNGQRVTSHEMISVIETVLFGQINQELVAALNEGGVPAVGLSGANNNLLFCRQANEQLGLVGTVESVNTEIVQELLNPEKNVVPVIAPIGIGANAELYNINADWAAAKIAGALKAKKLIFLTDQNGILDQNQQLIEHTSDQDLYNLISEGVVSGGMYTKVQTVVDALKHGVSQVRILRGTNAYDGLWSDYVGTMCSRSSNSMCQMNEKVHYV